MREHENGDRNVAYRFHARGGVNLYGAHIAGDLNCNGGEFNSRVGAANNLDKVSLNAANSTIQGSVLLGSRKRKDGNKDICIADQSVDFTNARISRDLECTDSHLSGGRFSLVAILAQIGGNVHLRDCLIESGANLSRAIVNGSLDCQNGRFFDGGEGALLAIGATVDGNVFLRAGFTAYGLVSLGATKIAGDLDLIDATFQNASKVALQLSWTSSHRLLETTQRFADILSEVGALDGFVYDEIDEDSPRDAGQRLRWLNRPPYTPQPYQQLAKVFRGHGQGGEAEQVLIRKESTRYRSLINRASSYSKPWLRLQRAALWTIDYGYRPLKALKFMLLFVVLGGFLFGRGYLHGIVTPTEKEAYSCWQKTGRPPEYYSPFNCLVYSIDSFFPLVEMFERKEWSPNPQRGTTFFTLYVFGHQFFIRSGAFLRTYLWFHILMGWFFTGMLAAGVTGLVRNLQSD